MQSADNNCRLGLAPASGQSTPASHSHQRPALAWSVRLTLVLVLALMVSHAATISLSHWAQLPPTWPSKIIQTLLDTALAVPILYWLAFRSLIRENTQRKRAEEALRESERHYRELLDALPVATHTTDAAGRIIYCNPAAIALWGRQPQPGEQWCGSHKLFSRDGVPIAHDQCPMATAIRENRLLFGVEAMAERPDGARFNFLAYATPFHNAAGAVVGAVNVMLDITERKRADERLRLQSSALQAAANGIVIASRDGFISWVNPAFTTLTGYTAAEAVGQNPRFLKSGRQDEPFYRQLWNTILSGQVWRGSVVNRRKDGSLYDEEMTITPVRVGDGDITHFIAIKLDVTERKRAEVALCESEAELNAILESTRDGILAVDSTGQKVFRANRRFAELWQVPRSLIQAGDNRALRASVLSQLADPDTFLKRVFAVYSSLSATVDTLDFKDGRVVERYGFPMLRDGALIGRVWSFRDITERKRAEAHQAAADKLILRSLQEKEVLLKEIHHRVKNNLQVISSMLGMQSDTLSDTLARERLLESQNRVRSMAMIHEKLYQSSSLAHVDFGEYVNSLTAFLFRAYSATASKVALNLATAEVHLNIDTAVPCGLILNELVSNALKHAFPDGRSGELRVALAVEADGYSLTVADNGVGLPPNYDIRASKSLGLQLVDALTHQLKGALTTSRQAGTTIRLDFKELAYANRT